jgi:Zn-dependent M28 family amino/carboxypeptidase
MRALPGFTASLNLRRAVLSEDRAPNVIGVIEGSDPVLRNEYVFFTAHMDHVGTTGVGPCRPVGADSLCNGADDDASGTAGVVELAEAFAMLNPRPRRSLVFMTVSGEERGLWGSEYYSEYPTLSLANTVAAFNIDMVGRNWRDTIVAIGQGHSSLGELANRVARAHPELNLRLIDDPWPQERFYERSDHYNFARKGVPILFFFSGVHPDYHRPTDTVDKIDAEKEARILRLIFYIGLETANGDARPEWNPESRRRIVETGSP